MCRRCVPICQEAEESILHALRDYPWVKAVWNRLGRVEVDQVFWSSELLGWLSRNGNKKSTLGTTNPPWISCSFSLFGIFGRAGITLFFKGKI